MLDSEHISGLVSCFKGSSAPSLLRFHFQIFSLHPWFIICFLFVQFAACKCNSPTSVCHINTGRSFCATKRCQGRPVSAVSSLPLWKTSRSWFIICICVDNINHKMWLFTSFRGYYSLEYKKSFGNKILKKVFIHHNDNKFCVSMFDSCVCFPWLCQNWPLQQYNILNGLAARRQTEKCCINKSRRQSWEAEMGRTLLSVSVWFSVESLSNSVDRRQTEGKQFCSLFELWEGFSILEQNIFVNQHFIS